MKTFLYLFMSFSISFVNIQDIYNTKKKPSKNEPFNTVIKLNSKNEFDRGYTGHFQHSQSLVLELGPNRQEWNCYTQSTLAFMFWWTRLNDTHGGWCWDYMHGLYLSMSFLVEVFKSLHLSQHSSSTVAWASGVRNQRTTLSTAFTDISWMPGERKRKG